MITEQFQPFITERRLPPREELVRIIAGGRTYQQIADQFGVTRQAVGKEYLKWKREAKILNELGTAPDDIADQFGVPRHFVASALAKK